MERIPLDQRFWRHVDIGGEKDCWPWDKPGENGYGRFKVDDGRQVGAHRVAYTLTYGPIPEGLQINHRCEHKPCCNPLHLEPTTPGENTRYSAHYNTRKTHCPQGHEYTPENTRVETGGKRRCRRCGAGSNRRRASRV